MKQLVASGKIVPFLFFFLYSGVATAHFDLFLDNLLALERANVFCFFCLRPLRTPVGRELWRLLPLRGSL